MNDDASEINYEDAVARLPDSDEIHTFRQPGAAMFLGADWDRAKLLAAMRAADTIYITGSNAQAMNHGLAIKHTGSILFIETKKEF